MLHLFQTYWYSGSGPRLAPASYTSTGCNSPEASDYGDGVLIDVWTIQYRPMPWREYSDQYADITTGELLRRIRNVARNRRHFVPLGYNAERNLNAVAGEVSSSRSD